MRLALSEGLEMALVYVAVVSSKDTLDELSFMSERRGDRQGGREASSFIV